MRIETAHQVFGNLKHRFDAACCSFASLQPSLSASCALPSGLLRHAILAIRRSRSSARTRWKQTHRTHIWCLFRQHRNRAARGAGRKVAGLAALCGIMSVPLSRRTEAHRRKSLQAQIACHCLYIGLHVRVAAPTLRQVQRRSIFPLLELYCVELEWRQCILAHAALVEVLLPRVFWT